MTTHFITAEIDLNEVNNSDLVDAVVEAISTQGEPLRWAITAVDSEKQVAHVEAVVTSSPEKQSEVVTTQ